ncbi:DUF3761 domain-containing protein [Streptomyces lydicus]|uniref:DUF3761 domain-containing protein n=1 Tax=Streptomyces lydicus TaxID=47763 RepID=UPI00378DD1D4
MLDTLTRRTRGAITAAVLATAALAPVTVLAAPAQAATIHCAHHTTGVCGTHIQHPRGSMAKCKDGTWSYSKHFSGTCSRHHGVRYWFK